MPHVNELKYTALVGITGLDTGHINELEIAWLRDVQGRAGDTLNELWINEFVANSGGTAKANLPFNQNAVLYLLDKGIPVQPLSTMWWLFWAGGIVAQQPVIIGDGWSLIGGTSYGYNQSAAVNPPLAFDGLVAGANYKVAFFVATFVEDVGANKKIAFHLGSAATDYSISIADAGQQVSLSLVAGVDNDRATFIVEDNAGVSSASLINISIINTDPVGP